MTTTFELSKAVKGKINYTFCFGSYDIAEKHFTRTTHGVIDSQENVTILLYETIAHSRGYLVSKKLISSFTTEK